MPGVVIFVSSKAIFHIILEKLSTFNQTFSIWEVFRCYYKLLGLSLPLHPPKWPNLPSGFEVLGMRMSKPIYSIHEWCKKLQKFYSTHLSKYMIVSYKYSTPYSMYEKEEMTALRSWWQLYCLERYRYVKWCANGKHLDLTQTIAFLSTFLACQELF